ncbi:MAG: ATP-binding protein [Geobacteraceae bacterium]|nr:ATP-binding protein [Geobacteraceae bacterium]
MASALLKFSVYAFKSNLGCRGKYSTKLTAYFEACEPLLASASVELHGLSIVYNIIVNKHQGSIDVSSTPGTGTTFTITLPVKMQPAD